MATESKQSAHGVRTYRGRTLEEILPQIREELGPDAIILREREGLVGGVGGFFAQRFVEVEARRGDGQSIDIYDDSPEDDLGAQLPGEEPTVTDRRTAAAEPIESLGGGGFGESSPGTGSGGPEDGGFEEREPERPAEPAEPRPFIPPSVEREQPQLQAPPPPPAPRQPAPAPPPPTRRAFETDVFLERLRAASQVLPDEHEDQVDISAASSAALRPPPAAVEREVVSEPELAPERETAPDAVAETMAESLAEPTAETSAAPPRPPRAPRTARAPGSRPERKPRTPPARKPRTSARPPRAGQLGTDSGASPATDTRASTPVEPETPPVAPQAPVAQAPAPHAPAATPPAAAPQPGPSREEPTTRGLAANPYESLRQRPPSLRAGLPTAEPAARMGASPGFPGGGGAFAGVGAEPFAGAGLSAPVPGATSVPPPPRALEIQERRHGLIRDTLARLFGGRLGQASVVRPSPPRPIDAVAATAIATDLGTRGASQSFAAELISTVGAHGSPLSGSLRAAAEAEVARRIVPAPTLPATGAAVAFIGAGGSGKTRCTAALASAYSRASTLGVTVISLDDPEGARELSRMLSADSVPVLSLSGERAARAVAEARQGGFVIIDTPTATPTDAAAVQALGIMLEPLQLDAKFVTLPATLGAQAARRALAGLGALNPSAVAVTHADETDQLAVIVEIAIAHRIPLAYVHAGTDHHSSLSAVNAAELAQQLLPS